MLDRYTTQGTVDALRRFGFTKEANQLELPHMGAPAAPPAAGGGFMDKVKAFGAGQWGAAKDLGANLRGGLGGKANPAIPRPSALDTMAKLPAGHSPNELAQAVQSELGAAHRGAALGNLKTLAPTLAAGGALYMLHRHNQAKQEQQARQQAMMMQGGGGYPMM